MKRNWEIDELIDHFILMPDEQELIQLKRGNTKLGFAVMFKFFQYKARFPHTKGEIPKTVIEYIAKQLEMNPDIFSEYDCTGRTNTYHRSEIRTYFGFREATLQDVDLMTDWLCKQRVLGKYYSVNKWNEFFGNLSIFVKLTSIFF
ncbi:DUF4158 domain-containing protein [Metabacillus sp. FJAT-53654]|uniref:DUF4158 domain-containing protein n=1 Tax=Metabacillus rhizosphaerae TaxID=3117747 RepID=A0ABZ2MP90_9BACI